MPVQTKRISQKQKLQKKFLSNQKFIETVCELSAEEYQMTLFELGCQFLETKCNRSKPSGDKKYLFIIERPKYWQWWKREFELFVNRQVEEEDFDWNKELWYSITSTVLESPMVKDGYLHQLK